jgi:hypothetical protein
MMASESVWALVSGLPTGPRERRLMMAIQVYFDDSGSSRRDPMYVLGGMLASTERWATFSDAWQACLTKHELDYFKMVEAQRPKGQFDGWDETARDAAVLELAGIAADHAMYRFEVSVVRSDYDDLMRGSTPLADFDDPYHLLFYSACRAVMEVQVRDGLDEECDYIFDVQSDVGARALEWWKRDALKWFHPKVHHLFKNPPVFRDDKQFLPLQAADMYAWLLRDRHIKLGHGKPVNPPLEDVFERFKPVKHERVVYDRDRLSKIRASQSINTRLHGIVRR